MIRRARLSRPAESDIDEILALTGANLAEPARLRYAALIAAAIRDVSTDAERAGTKARPEFGYGAYSWHLHLSRIRSSAEPVRRPRHVLIYRVDDTFITIGRVLYDAMDLTRHVASETAWE